MAQSRSACQDFQLQAYRQQYGNGDQCWAREKGLRGATEYCCNLAFGGNPTACRRDEARTNIDWVFQNVGARSTYEQGRRGGQTPFEACIRAQGHNPNAANSIRQCSSYSTAYCSLKDREMRGDSTAPVGCDAAEKSILWLLFLDEGAILSYRLAKKKMSRFDAAISALSHDRPAQNNVRICRNWADVFLATNDPWEPLP